MWWRIANTGRRRMNLSEELAAFAKTMPTRRPPEQLAIIERATRDLVARGIAERALKEGDVAPEFALPDSVGRIVSLREKLARGPVVLSFYRGGWCPYCNLELRAYQRLLPEIAGLGASLMAVSPQTPDRSLSTAEKNALAFKVLSDVGLHAAGRFGIVFALPPDLQTLYADFGNIPPVVNGDGTWRLPVPATYVIAADRRIVLAGVDPDYRHRLDPAEVLHALRSLRANRAAA
jgi:peroxiredoxin